MAIADARCPRCGFARADVWRDQVFTDHRIRHVVCRSCAFVFGITEPVVDSNEPDEIIFVPFSGPMTRPFR